MDLMVFLSLLTSSIDIIYDIKKQPGIYTETDHFCMVTTVSKEDNIIQGYTSERIKEEQSKDENLKFLWNWLVNGQEPLENELFLSSPAAKNYWINKDLFFLDENGIIRNIPKKDENRSRLVIPASLQKNSNAVMP